MTAKSSTGSAATPDKPIDRYDEGPRKWLTPSIEETYSRIIPREQEGAEEAIAGLHNCSFCSIRSEVDPRKG